jgi:hypothetical protein
MYQDHDPREVPAFIELTPDMIADEEDDEPEGDDEDDSD